MVVRGCLFCHRFAENLVTTHFPICPFYVAYISYAVCQGPGLSKNQRLYKSTICILLFQSICYCCALCVAQYQFGCGNLKMVGPKKQDFWPKINILKGNHCILRIRGAPVRQKLGMILENKVVEQLKLEKNVFFTKN